MMPGVPDSSNSSTFWTYSWSISSTKNTIPPPALAGFFEKRIFFFAMSTPEDYGPPKSLCGEKKTASL